MTRLISCLTRGPHIWISHVTLMNGSRDIDTRQWRDEVHLMFDKESKGETSRHVPHMNASCHTYESVMSHIWMSHITRMNGSCHTDTRRWRDEAYLTFNKGSAWEASRLVPHINESCHTYESVMSHRRRSHVTRINSHVTRMNASCHTYERVT